MRVTLLFFLLLSYFGVGATHIQGGYIRVTPVAGQALTYTITVLIYTEPASPAARDMKSIPICLGDGTTRIINQKSQSVVGTGGRLAASVFETTYTYAGAGNYQLMVSLANRTPLLNGPSNADQTLFTIATTFTISNTGSNSTPLPVTGETNFVVGVNQRATLSLRATDAEGDSLIYRLAVPMTSSNTTLCTSSRLSGYSYPNDVARQGTFTLNGRTGELVWLAPVREGRYNVAVYIDEYRNGINISQTLEEITLLAEDQPGSLPVTLPPYEPAVTSAIITALSEQDDAAVQLSVFPNPVEENLQVVVQSSMSGPVVVQLFDTSGRQIHQLGSGKAVRRHEQVIGMGSLSKGTYLIRAEVAGRVLTEKVVKK